MRTIAKTIYANASNSKENISKCKRSRGKHKQMQCNASDCKDNASKYTTAKTHHVLIAAHAVDERKGVVYTDATGAFPTTLQTGNKYIAK